MALWTFRRKWLVHSAVAVALWGGQAAPVAALTERIVNDWRTGLALHGFDPVTYFTQEGPRPGRAEFEHSHAGVVWRFRNEGNRAAFAERPEVYVPKFGGYDAVALARGSAAPGHPEVWLIHENRLFLFHNDENRAAFTASTAPVLEAAESNWPRVMKGLAP